MAKSRAELLAEIANSTPTGGGNNLRDGRYRLLVRKTGFGDGFNGPRWDFDWVVQHCAKIPVVELKTGKALDIEPNAVGTDVGMVKMLTHNEPYEAPGLGDTKAIVLTLYGISDVDKQELMATLDVLDRENLAYGMAIDCVTRRKISKKKEVEMVLQDWFHVELSDEEIAKNRKWMESLAQQAPATPQAPAPAAAAAPPAWGPPPA